MKRGFQDFFIYKYNMTLEETENVINKLEDNKPFMNEMYNAIMYEEFPVKCWAKVDGRTALEYSVDLGLNLDEAYMYMTKKL